MSLPRGHSFLARRNRASALLPGTVRSKVPFEAKFLHQLVPSHWDYYAK